MAKVYINEQDNGSWKITTCDKNHKGHEISESNYINQNKEIDEKDKAMVSEMLNVQANNKNIADVLSKKTGKIFNSQLSGMLWLGYMMPKKLLL